MQAIHDAEDDLEKIKLLAEEAREKLQQVGMLEPRKLLWDKSIGRLNNGMQIQDSWRANKQQKKPLHILTQ